jgi:Uma2 family endonuclease
VQDPIVLGDLSEPQPDLALLRPRHDFYADSHPRPEDILLVVEVADTTVAFDRHTKLPLYARHAIPEAWLVDLPAGVLEIHRTPEEGAYARVEPLGPDDLSNVPVPGLPGVTVDLTGLL